MHIIIKLWSKVNVKGSIRQFLYWSCLKFDIITILTRSSTCKNSTDTKIHRITQENQHAICYMHSKGSDALSSTKVELKNTLLLQNNISATKNTKITSYYYISLVAF